MVWKPQDQCTVDPITSKREGPGSISTFFLLFFGVALCFDVTSTLFWSSFKKDLHKLLLYIAICVDIFAFYLYWAFYVQCRPWTGWLLFASIGVVIKVIVWIVLINDVAKDEPIKQTANNDQHQVTELPPPILTESEKPKWVIESGNVSMNEADIYLRGSGAKVTLRNLTPPLQIKFSISVRSGPFNLSIDGGGAKFEKKIGSENMLQVIRWQTVVVDVKNPMVTFELDEGSTGTVVISKQYVL